MIVYDQLDRTIPNIIMIGHHFIKKIGRIVLAIIVVLALGNTISFGVSVIVRILVLIASIGFSIFSLIG